MSTMREILHLKVRRCAFASPDMTAFSSNDPSNPDLNCNLDMTVPEKSNNVSLIVASFIAGLLLIGMAIAIVYYLVDQTSKIKSIS